MMLVFLILLFVLFYVVVELMLSRFIIVRYGDMKRNSKTMLCYEE